LYAGRIKCLAFDDSLDRLYILPNGRGPGHVTRCPIIFHNRIFGIADRHFKFRVLIDT